jgi:hypothetical protein
MATRKPEPAKPISWDVSKIGNKLVFIGSVEAVDADAAI